MHLLETLYESALSAVEPSRLVRDGLASPDLERAVARAASIGLFAVGKAAAGMSTGALSRLDPRDALVVVPKGYPVGPALRRFTVFASHPEPDASSLRAARRALRFFRAFHEGDLMLCLVSGGASSLLCLPRPGVTLAEKRRAVRALVRRGAPIAEVNRLRTSLSAVKGGRLGQATRARLATLVLSDVPGDRAALVGSGPTIRGDRHEDIVRVIGSNRTGLEAAARQARRRGLAVRLLRERLSGDAARMGLRLARRIAAVEPGTVLLAGGETVVDLAGSRRRGGRCLELALAAAMELDGGTPAALLAAGSDGRDGSSSAAGAFVDQTTLRRARGMRLDAHRALRIHDSHAFFARLGLLLDTGPTGTNVGDWVFGIRRDGRVSG